MDLNEIPFHDEIHNITQLNYHFHLNDRFIYAKNDHKKYFTYNTPFLKVLKPLHIAYNKKKNNCQKIYYFGNQ